MSKVVTDKQAFKAMKKLRRYCKQHIGQCDDSCRFYREPQNFFDDLCGLRHAPNPSFWESGKERKQ